MATHYTLRAVLAIISPYKQYSQLWYVARRLHIVANSDLTTLVKKPFYSLGPEHTHTSLVANNKCGLLLPTVL